MGGCGGIGDQQVEINGQQRQEQGPSAGAQRPFPLLGERASNDQQQAEIGAGARLSAGAGAEEHQAGCFRIACQLGQSGSEDPMD